MIGLPIIWRLRTLAFATFLVWRLRIGTCGFWRLWQLPDRPIIWRLRTFTFATFLVWRLRIGACGIWRYRMHPQITKSIARCNFSVGVLTYSDVIIKIGIDSAGKSAMALSRLALSFVLSEFIWGSRVLIVRNPSDRRKIAHPREFCTTAGTRNPYASFLWDIAGIGGKLSWHIIEHYVLLIDWISKLTR